MDSLNSIKAQGIKKIQSRKYNDAISDFTSVIDQIPQPEDDNQANLKSTCLINRASCNLMLLSASSNKSKEELISFVQKAIDDSNQSIAVLNQIRKSDNDYFFDLVKEKKTDELKTDALTHLYALSNLRLGESYESLNECQKAFHHYSIAYNAEQFDDKNPNFNNNQEAKKAIREFLQKRYNVPDIKSNVSNSDFQDLVSMRQLITYKSEMSKSMTSFLSRIYAKQISAQTIKKLETLKYLNLIYAVLHLYIDDQMILLQALAITRFICNMHFRSFYDHLFILKDVIKCELQKENPSMISECAKILALAPRDDHNALINNGFIPLCLRCLELGEKIKDEDADYIFCFFFAISQTPSNLHYITVNYDNNGDKKGDEEEELDIVKYILTRKQMYGIMLLGKISQHGPALFQAEKLGAVDWLLQVLKGILDVDVPDFVIQKRDIIFCAETYLSRLLLKRNEEENKAAEKEKQEISKTVEILVPLLKKGSKSEDIVSVCFSYLAQATQYVPEKIKELHVVVLASLMLHLNMKCRPVVQNIVTFLYETADHAHLIDEIKGCKAAIPNVLNAVHDHARSQTIVERATALVFLCDHESKDKLLAAALEQYPKDEFIEKFLANHMDLVDKYNKQ